MEQRIVLSIDGRAGAELVQDRESHLRGLRTRADNVHLPPGSDGREGVDAPPALSGEPAGAVAVEISRSRLRDGGITVTVIGEPRVMRSPLPQVTEIPPHYKVHLSAVGGKGEPGRKGGMGTPGVPGQNGTNATRVEEATDGGQGGTGGTGGRGSDGGRGGPGGKILVYVDESQTELLHAVTWDTSGGLGGEPGTHGENGDAGLGGNGGSAVVWEDISHYKYSCTQYCIGGTSEVAVLPHGGDATLEMIRRIATAGSRSSLLSNALVTAVGTANRMQRPTVDGGACRCKGGPTHCPACEKKPIYRTFSKPAGRDGPPGIKGAQRPPQDNPLEGESGDNGSVEITVRHKNGDRPKYGSKFDLELASFDVEDGNGDGIFEPGEDILVRQVRVQNKGGMPSPSSAIYCQVTPLDLVASGQGEDTRASLPSSIPASNIEYAEGSIRCSLNMPTMNARSVPPYASEQKITLQAVLPWLKYPLEQFDVAKPITVQFPLELRNIKVPSALAPRFGYSVRWQILNKSRLLFGNGASVRRVAKVLVMVDSKQGEMLDATGTPVSSVELTVPDIPSQSNIEMTQRVRAKESATPHEDLNISLQLFISSPKQGFTENCSINTLQLIESHKTKIQIAPGHTPSPDDDVLVVTNPAIKKAQLEAVVQWLEGELFLKTNIWNVGIHGGLLTVDQSDEDVLHNILHSYAGKFVVILGTRFVLGGQGVSVLKVCDAESLQDACDDETSCLFLGANNDPAGRIAFEGLLRPMHEDPVAIASSLPEPFRFQKEGDLIRCLQRSGGDGSKHYLLKVSKSKFRKDISNVRHAAKKLATSLREKVPHSHFVVCMIPSENQYQKDQEDGKLLVRRGLNRSDSLGVSTSDLFSTTDDRGTDNVAAVAPAGLQRAFTLSRKKVVSLSAFDRFCILGSMPFHSKLKLLDETPSHPLTAETTKLVVLSICSQIDHEIQTFLAESEWPNSVDTRLKGSMADFLPSVYRLLSKLLVTQNPSPQLLSVVSYCQASARPQNSQQSFSQKALPFGHRRSQLFKHIAKTMIEALDTKSKGGRLKKPIRFRGSEIFEDTMTVELCLAPPEGRCTSSSLIKMISEVTGKSQHFQDRASYGVGQALVQNDVLDVAGWQQHAQRSQSQREEVLQLFHRFREEQETYGISTDEKNPAYTDDKAM